MSVIPMAGARTCGILPTLVDRQNKTISDVTRGNEFGNSHVGMTDATDEHDHAAITIFGR
jgi:hypothetical protein